MRGLMIGIPLAMLVVAVLLLLFWGDKIARQLILGGIAAATLIAVIMFLGVGVEWFINHQ